MIRIKLYEFLNHFYFKYEEYTGHTYNLAHSCKTGRRGHGSRVTTLSPLTSVAGFDSLYGLKRKCW